MPLFNGIEFDFGGGRVYVIPTLTLGDMRRLRSEVTALRSAIESDSAVGADICIKLAHAALRRNYPDITEDQVSELVDMDNMHEVIMCAIDVGGERRKQSAVSVADYRAKHPGCSDAEVDAAMASGLIRGVWHG